MNRVMQRQERKYVADIKAVQKETYAPCDTEVKKEIDEIDVVKKGDR